MAFGGNPVLRLVFEGNARARIEMVIINVKRKSEYQFPYHTNAAFRGFEMWVPYVCGSSVGKFLLS